jgi:hypothetical protein
VYIFSLFLTSSVATASCVVFLCSAGTVRDRVPSFGPAARVRMQLPQEHCGSASHQCTLFRVPVLRVLQENVQLKEESIK